MKTKSLPLYQILIQHLKQKSPQIVHGGTMEKVAQSYGYEAETGKRRLREICTITHDNYDPHVHKDYSDGCVVYWYK